MDQSGGLVPGSRIKSPAKSTTVVTPPNAAARVAASGGCDRSSGRPPQYCGTGMAMWACGSMPPGRTILPSASMTRAASPGSEPGDATATILPSRIPTSPGAASCAVTTRPRRITRSSIGRDEVLGTEAGGAHPAGLGDVEHHVVRAAVLHLDVVLVLALAHAERFVDVVARLGPGGGEPLGDRLEVVHLEPDVMDAGEALAPLGPGHGVVLELEDGQIEIAVAQVVPAGVRVVDPPDLLHAEHVDVELRGLVGVLGGHRNVLDLGHGILHGSGVYRCPVVVRTAVRVNRHRDSCREHMICPLPRASEMSAFAGRRATAIVNQGGDDGARRGRPGAGHEDPRGHHASVGWSHHLVAGGRYPGPRSAQRAALARPLRSRGARRAL